jgi:hypothetical protein
MEIIMAVWCLNHVLNTGYVYGSVTDVATVMKVREKGKLNEYSRDMPQI